jgi:hypothetical protein
MQNEETEVWRGAQTELHTSSFYLLPLKVVAGAGIAPAFAPSKGAVLRLDDPAGGKAKTRMQNGTFREAPICFCILPSSCFLQIGGAGGSCNLTIAG